MKNNNDEEIIKQLKGVNEKFLIEHYRRCESFWRHWTPTIWSIPSIASAINIGAYTLIFSSTQNISICIKILGSGILFFLNSILALGIYKNKYFQDKFGDRIVAIEKSASIPDALEDRPKDKHKDIITGVISAGWAYFILMVILTIISFVLFAHYSMKNPGLLNCTEHIYNFSSSNITNLKL